MSLALLRLGFAGVWLVVAGVLLTGAGGRQAEVAGLLAVALAVWNLARWRQTRARPEVGRRRSRPPSVEYHPEFDFGGPHPHARRASEGDGPSAGDGTPR